MPWLHLFDSYSNRAIPRSYLYPTFINIYTNVPFLGHFIGDMNIFTFDMNVKREKMLVIVQ